MSALSLCVHGHFYQPPRENPFSGTIPAEPGATPFGNFNEKIHDECYKPNVDLGNFQLMSFNLGPTLARWIQKRFPSTHAQIVNSDHYHQHTFGQGNGMAQAYNHTILPLAAHRDKVTQIAWGITDFHHRFGHHPQGMWLPEMAVDMDTLEVMYDQGLRYTILTPEQVRLPDGGAVPRSSQLYYVQLSNGHRFTLFLRDQRLSNRLAFDPEMTQNATRFAQWCRETVAADAGLFLIATDGETFGHHQPLRQFFLQAFLRSEAAKVGFEVTTPAKYMGAHPATQRVLLNENTAWSCAHGVDRWQSGCTCTSGDTRWKPRLRAAFDRLAGSVDALYQSACAGWIGDPWALRDAYINVILGRTGGIELLEQFSSSPIDHHTAASLLHLLEAERYCQAMYTSCGWFFDDLKRIEARNNIAYAAMAVRQVELATAVDATAGINLAGAFRDDLAAAKSGVTAETGREIYDAILAGR